MSECKECKHDGNQSIFPSACTGCGGDGEGKNFEPMTKKISESDVCTKCKLSKLEPKLCTGTPTGHIFCKQRRPTLDKLIAHYRDSEWRNVDELTLNHGAVLLFSPEWIDEDFNPSGTREGFRNETDTGPIYSAKWNPCQDCWDTEENSKPTKFKVLPLPEKDDG